MVISNCSDGYFGNFCNQPCPPGFFGSKCGGQCFPKCTQMDCDHVSGCPKTFNDTSKKNEPYTPTKRETSLDLSTLSTTWTPSNTDILFITEDLETKIEINKNHVIAGGVTFKALFLFIIVLQLCTCKRSKTERTKTKKGNACEQIEATQSRRFFNRSTDNVQHDDECTNDGILRVRNKTNLNQPVDSNYQYIDVIPEVSNASREYEEPIDLLQPKHSYSPLEPGNNCQSSESNDHYVDPLRRHSDVNISDIYLQPIFV